MKFNSNLNIIENCFLEKIKSIAKKLCKKSFLTQMKLLIKT